MNTATARRAAKQRRIERLGQSLIRERQTGEIVGALAGAGFPSQGEGERAVLFAFARCSAVRKAVYIHLLAQRCIDESNAELAALAAARRKP